jgi:hypothetical protein
VIWLARALATRGHEVVCYSNCDRPVEDHGVRWRPLKDGLPETCDLYLPVHQTELLGLVRRPRRLALWVVWPARQLGHYKRVFSQWRHRPVPVFASLDGARTYAWWLPRREPKIVIPLGLPDDIRGLGPLAEAPPRHAVFTSNASRNLHQLVGIWLNRVIPRVPDAVLQVYGVSGFAAGADVWQAWSGTWLPPDIPEPLRRTVRIHTDTSRKDLMQAVRGCRVMPYLGHKGEAFCLALAEAQAMGVPCVVAPKTVLPERVIDGVTGYVRGDVDGFVAMTVALLTDDALWRSQHQQALRLRQGVSWAEVAARLEFALLSDLLPTDWAVADSSVGERLPPLLGAPNGLA